MIAYFVVLCASVLHCLADAVHRNNDVNLQQWLPDLAELEGLSRTCQADTPNSQDKKTPSSRDAALDARAATLFGACRPRPGNAKDCEKNRAARCGLRPGTSSHPAVDE